jgi:hypothetical protein
MFNMPPRYLMRLLGTAPAGSITADDRFEQAYSYTGISYIGIRARSQHIRELRCLCSISVESSAAINVVNVSEIGKYCAVNQA